MSVISIVIVAFSLLGALDKLFGDRFGLGKEFERAFVMFAPVALSMIGILVLAPAIGVWLKPVFDWFYAAFKIDPSIIPASLFANDMGGMTVSQQICIDPQMGNFNAFIVSSMMGCVVSYTLPVGLGLVKQEQHGEMFFGLLCGIVTIPVGCLISGLMCGLGVWDVIKDLLPLLVISVVIGAGLLLAPNACIRIFKIFGQLMRGLSIVGLGCAIFTFLTGRQLNPHFDTLENTAFICVNACVTLSGALPFMYLMMKLLRKPVDRLGAKMGVNGTSALCLFSTLVSSTPVYGMMDQMDAKGVALNAAFSVSAAFALGAHLALTVVFDERYVVPMLVGKLISGLCALALALVLYRKKAMRNF